MSLFDMFQPREPQTGGVGDTPLNAQYTPDRISSLGPNDIFVFGSNIQGRHAGGAARVAMNRFGAIFGQGVGLQGNTYAIPTMQGGVATIKPYVDEFIDFAKSRPDLTFYVTKIGCGIEPVSLLRRSPPCLVMQSEYLICVYLEKFWII